MKNITIQIMLAFVLTLSIIGCDKKRIYENYHPIPHSGWSKDSVEIFEFPVFDVKSKYNLYVNIRNDINYPYSNLWLFIEINQPDGKTQKKIFEVYLAEGSGKWLGSGMGGIKSLSTVYQADYLFSVPGIYKINIQHGMREELLKGIRDIGFRVEK